MFAISERSMPDATELRIATARDGRGRRSDRRITPRLLPGFLLLLLPVLGGCGSEAPEGAGDTDISHAFDGAIDPGAGSIRLTSTTVPGPDGTPVEIVLIGRNLRSEPVPESSGAVAILLDVSVRNDGAVPLYAPAELAVSRLAESIRMIDADWTACPRCLPTPECGCTYGFSYADRLGDDALLGPGEESEPRAWRFRMEHVQAFSFAVQARFGVEPDRPHISGVLFHDADENGLQGPGEFPMGGGSLRIDGPGVEGVVVAVREDGAWALPVRDAGLYTILATPPPTFAPVHFTTPNPLQVVLARTGNGSIESFEAAHFGLANDALGALPQVRFAEDPSQFRQDSYDLIDAGLADAVLSLRIGFSGCGPDHPLALYMVGGFMESNPVQARIVLSHNNQGEMCAAYFTRLESWDLTPIREAYRRAYGKPGTVVLNLVLPDGGTRQFRLAAE